MDDFKVKPADSDGVFFDLDNSSDVASNNFGVAANSQAPDRYVKHILNLGLNGEGYKFKYIARRYNEKKALLKALEGEFIVALNGERSEFQLTQKGFLATRFR